MYVYIIVLLNNEYSNKRLLIKKHFSKKKMELLSIVALAGFTGCRIFSFEFLDLQKIHFIIQKYFTLLHGMQETQKIINESKVGEY